MWNRDEGIGVKDQVQRFVRARDVCLKDQARVCTFIPNNQA
jgi:hypothetical protein